MDPNNQNPLPLQGPKLPPVQAYPQPAAPTPTVGGPNGAAANSPTSGGVAPASPNPKKKLIIIGAVIGAVFLIAIIAAVFLSGSKPKSAKPTAKQSTSQVDGPSAATSSSVQQSDDAISQYLSTLDDVKDFPAKALDNTTLGLQ